MARQLQEMKADVDIGVRSDARGIASSTEITSLFNKRLRLLKARGEFRGTLLSTPVDIFSGIYEYTVPTAYKATKLLRPTSGYQNIDMVTSNEWREKKETTNDNLIAEEQYSDDKILLIRVDTGEAITVLDSLAEYDDNGTFAAVASTDAINVRTVEGSRYESSSAVAFDVDVSAYASHTAGIEKTLTTSVDLSANEDIGTGFMNIFLPSGLTSLLTSVRLRWGSSSSNYWEVTVTECFNGRAFSRGKNVLGFTWPSSETGSPDSSAVDYVQVLLTYDSTTADAALVAIENLRFVNPSEYTHEYYSTRFAKSSAGALQDEFSADDDTSLLEDFEDDMLVEGVVADVNHLRVDMNGSARAEARFEEYYREITNNKPSEKQKASQSYYEL